MVIKRVPEMNDDDMPEETWQGYAPEDSWAVIKLIAMGQQSKRYFQSIQAPIQELDVILDDPKITQGIVAHIQDIILNTDLLFVSVFLEEPRELEMAQKILEIAHAIEIPTVSVALTSKKSDSEDMTTESHQLLSLYMAYHGAIFVISIEPTSEYVGNPLGDNEPAGVMAVRAITETITRPGLVGLDYADVRNMMLEKGVARVGFGFAVGDNRAREATDQAISSLHRNKVDLADAKTILINITAGLDMSVDEFDEVTFGVRNLCSDGVPVVAGVPIVPEMVSGIRVTIVATGFG